MTTYAAALRAVPFQVRERAPVYAPDARSFTARRVLEAFAWLRRAEAVVTEATASIVARSFDTRAHEQLGYARFGDFVRERLHVSPRTASEWRALNRVLSHRPAVREAFLNGDVTSCQVQTLAGVLTNENEAYWLIECRSLSVRQLRDRIRVDGGTPPEKQDFRTVAFDAPPAVAVLWEQTLEAARRVLGHEAPRHDCVDAVLSEASARMPSLAGATDRGSTGARRSSRAAAKTAADESRRPPLPVIPLDRRAAARLEQTLALVTREIDGLGELVAGETSESAVPGDDIRRVTALQQLGRPLRLLTGRLLRDTRESGVLAALGFLRLEDFAVDVMRVSRNTAHNLLREAELFFDCPALEEAFAHGRIGVAQAVLICRQADARGPEDYLDRAGEVTVRQFQREVRLVERLQDVMNVAGPMPIQDLDEDLQIELRLRGWSKDRIETSLEAAGLAGAGADDPGENPHAMRRLETLANWLILTVCEDDADDACDEAAAQTFANADVTVVTTDFPREGGRTMSRPRPMTSIAFRAPEDVRQRWSAVVGALRKARRLPVWACVTLLLREALEEWESASDRSRHWRILERDGYLCQVPGCGSRKLLQVHHIVFRSRGGGDDRGNLITLCFAHHQMLHETGRIALEGSASRPVWTQGGRRYLGERVI